MIPVDPPYRDSEWLPQTREDCYKLGWTTARKAIRSTGPADGEALRRLIERIEALERIVPANLEGDELDRRNGEYVNLNDLREVLSAARLAPLSGPVDASGESCAYAECVWPKCREYGGYITNPLCSKRTSAPAAAVPSSPAQDWKP